MHLRRTTLRLFLLLVLLVWATAVPVIGQPGQVKLASLKLGDSPYEIARPALWRQGPVTGESVLSSWVASDQFLYPLMSVTLEPLPSAGESGVEQLLSTLPNVFPGYRELQGGWVEIGGIRAHRSLSAWTSIFGELKATRLLVPWQDKVFVITFADLESTFASNAQLYDLCISALAPFKPVEVEDKKP